MRCLSCTGDACAGSRPNPPEQLGPHVLVPLLGQGLQDLPLPAPQFFRPRAPAPNDGVPPPRPAPPGPRSPCAPHLELLPALGAGRYPEPDRPAPGLGRLDLGPQGRLDKTNRHRDDEVVALPLEDGVFLDPRHHEQVPGRTAAPAGAPPARHLDLHPVPGAGRYPDLDLLHAARLAVPPAPRTRCLHDAPPAPATGARRRQREQPLVPALRPAPPALWARPRRRPWRGPAPPAVPASLLYGDPYPRRHAIQCVLELQLDAYGD